MTGILALVGGGEWSDGCDFDTQLLSASGAGEVAVLPTASAFERPELLLERATNWFTGLGASVREVPVYTRRDALVAENISAVRNARFIYMAGGSPMHLRAVLKDTPLYEAMVEAYDNGAVLAGSAAGADVLCDPMVDTRGGALTVGLGLVPGVAVIPRYDTWSQEKIRRTVTLTRPGQILVGVPEATALIRDPDGTWRSAGRGEVTVYVDGQVGTLADLSLRR